MTSEAVFRKACSAIAIVLLCGSALSAPVRITGGISSTVADNSGGVVPGATVQSKDDDEGTGTQKHEECGVEMGGSVV